MRCDIYAATFESLDSNIHFLPADTGPQRNKTDSSEVETATQSEPAIGIWSALEV